MTGNLCLLDHDLGQSEIIITDVNWAVWLVMAAEQRMSLTNICPFGEALAPPAVILGEGMKLWQVEGNSGNICAWREKLWFIHAKVRRRARFVKVGIAGNATIFINQTRERPALCVLFVFAFPSEGGVQELTAAVISPRKTMSMGGIMPLDSKSKSFCRARWKPQFLGFLGKPHLSINQRWHDESGRNQEDK